MACDRQAALSMALIPLPPGFAMNSASQYGAVAVAVHWLTVALVGLAWLLGNFGDDLPRGAPRSISRFIHISAGLAILGLLVLRIQWRVFGRPPPLETTPLGSWLSVAAKLTHLALYALLTMTPLVGIVQFARGDALPIFGIVEIASPWIRDRAFAGAINKIHQTLANVPMIAAALHAAAALAHYCATERWPGCCPASAGDARHHS
jgi:cytochrome b561